MRKPAGEELIDLLDRVLDKGIVVDASSRLRLGVANLINHKKHVVIASIETHLQHGEARVVERFANRQPLSSEEHPPAKLPRPANRGRR
ncbi:MAG TPA: gas vesicle protein GvpJ [Terriglobales bacterium]